MAKVLMCFYLMRLTRTDRLTLGPESQSTRPTIPVISLLVCPHKAADRSAEW